MAMQRAAAEPDVLAFDAEITAVDGPTVTLDQTYFYAESGGQPSDRGTIAGITVADVVRENGTTKHLLDEPAEFDVGDAVSAEIDPSFRRYCMAAHTASHAVYGAARQLYDSLGYGGFEITPEKVRIDLETPEPIDDPALFDLERLTNQVVWEDRPVTWSEWATAEVRERDDIALNVATEVVDEADVVRVVEIEEWDIAACGGTHMTSTGAIGAVAMIDRSNPGEGMTRVEFVVGADRIAHHAEEKRAAWAAARHLGVGIAEVPARLEGVLAERDRLQESVASAERTIARLSLASDAAIRAEVDGVTWAIATTTSEDTNTVADAVADAQGDIADVVALAGSTGRAFLVVASDGEPDADAIVDAVLEVFEGGGGGGSPTRAQAGGIDADPDQVLSALCEHFGVA